MVAPEAPAGKPVPRCGLALTGSLRAAAAAQLPCLLIEGGYTIEAASQLGAWKTVSDFRGFVQLFSATGI